MLRTVTFLAKVRRSLIIDRWLLIVVVDCCCCCWLLPRRTNTTHHHHHHLLPPGTHASVQIYHKLLFDACNDMLVELHTTLHYQVQLILTTKNHHWCHH